jgi:hypothetical protein
VDAQPIVRQPHSGQAGFQHEVHGGSWIFRPAPAGRWSGGPQAKPGHPVPAGSGAETPDPPHPWLPRTDLDCGESPTRSVPRLPAVSVLWVGATRRCLSVTRGRGDRIPVLFGVYGHGSPRSLTWCRQDAARAACLLPRGVVSVSRRCLLLPLRT